MFIFVLEQKQIFIHFLNFADSMRDENILDKFCISVELLKSTADMFLDLSSYHLEGQEDRGYDC